MPVPKPSKPCRIVPSFAIGADVHRYFGETFNWLVSCFENMKGVKGVEKGAPVVEAGGTDWTGGFSYVNGEIKSGCVMIGRRAIKVSGLPLKTNDGTYCVCVTLTSSTPSASIMSGDGFAAPDGNTSYIPLYTLKDGKIIEDYRGASTIPVWE